MHFTSLAAFVLLSLAGVQAQGWPTGVASTAGLHESEPLVKSLCSGPAQGKTIAYACFKIDGDIRKHMYNPSNLLGYYNKAGDTFVILHQGSYQSFNTETDKVTISTPGPATPRCPKVLHEWQVLVSKTEARIDFNFPDVCPGSGPYPLKIS